MRSDPRIGLAVSLAFVAVGLLWLFTQYLASTGLVARFGYVVHAITLLSIFIVAAGSAAAAVFWRFAQVKAELLAGRRVVGQWRIDAATLATFARSTADNDTREKRHALFVMWFFLAAIFGAFAIYDREAAPMMLAMAAAVAAALGMAYLAGQRIDASHLEPHSDRVIVGERGLLFNGVLHVWGLPLTWLSDVRFGEQPRALFVTYGYLSRAGSQYVTVGLPVPAGSVDAARRADCGLRGLLGRAPRALRRNKRSPTSR